MFEQVPQSSFLGYEESFQSQLRTKGKTSWPSKKTPPAPPGLGGERAGWERPRSGDTGKAVGKTVANEQQRRSHALSPDTSSRAHAPQGSLFFEARYQE